MRICEMPIQNRPRERFQALGPWALSDAELLALVLQKGTRQENVVEVSNQLIARFGLGKLATASFNDLQEVRGIGPAKAAQIAAVFELHKRCILTTKVGVPITSARDVYEYASQKLFKSDQEQFLVLLLDSKNRVIKDEMVSLGTLNMSLVHPREVFKVAIRQSANSIILVHNHPSGDPSPSREDEDVTRTFKEAGDLLNLEVLDHVIIGKERYYSFTQDGRK